MTTLLSTDKHILLSIINMKLRDQYKSITDLCDDMNIEQKELEMKLLEIDYVYSDKNNQFVSNHIG